MRITGLRFLGLHILSGFALSKALENKFEAELEFEGKISSSNGSSLST